MVGFTSSSAGSGGSGSGPIILLRILLIRIAALLPRRRRLSLVAIKDIYLTLSFLRFGLVPTTVSLPSSGASMRLWTPGGRRIGRRRVSPAPALVLVHGFGADAKWQFTRQIGPLSQRFDLYVPDLVFFGGSRSDGEDRSVGFQARCVREAMARLGVSRYSVVGVSYGGFVAFRMAAEAAEGEVERAVIMTAGVAAADEERMEFVEKEGREVCDLLLPRQPEDLMALMRRSMDNPPRWLPEFLLRDFIDLMYKDNRKEKVELLWTLMQQGVGLQPLPILSQETLIIWGDRDKVFPLHLAYRLHKHLGEKSKLEILEGAGHALQLEKPNAVNRLIEQFLLPEADDDDGDDSDGDYDGLRQQSMESAHFI